MIKDYLNLAFTNIKHRQLRSWLTIIGIIIGVAAIVSLITISQGLENAIQEQFEQFGSDRIYIAPKMQGLQLSDQGLTKDDVDTLKGIAELEWVNPMVIDSEEVEFSREKQFIQQIVGLEIDDIKGKYGDIGLEMYQGNYPADGSTGIAVLGYKIANDKFDKIIGINNRIKIKGKKFKVVGIFEEIGNSDDDNMIMLNIDDFRDLFNKPDIVNAIEVKLKEGQEIDEVAEIIQRKLEKARDDDFFTVMTPQSILDQLGSILLIVQIVLGGIASIALLVGGIGILNSMYTSVLERTKQIGIMKSVGARNNHIFAIFVVEAGLIGLAGGIAGVILGSLISLAVGVIAKQAGFALLKIVIDWKLILFGLAFAVGMGMISGFLPARRAAKLQPVEALRS